MNTRVRVTGIPSLLAAAMLGKIATPTAIFAQAEAGPFDDLGLETLSLIVTPETITGMPEELAAGHYLVDLSGEPMEGETSLSAMLYKLPEGMTADSLTPIDPESPVVPDYIYEGGFAGGRDVQTAQGETSSQCVLTLTPGDWVVLGALSGRPNIPFTVTGEVPADAPTPAATAEITMGEMYFHVTGGELAAGKNLLALTSMGGQPHFMIMLPLPPGMTNDEFGSMFAGGPPEEEEASPESEGEGGGEGEMPTVIVTGVQSLATTMWTELELASGTYGLACFVPDQHVGMPHAMLGMHAVVVIP